MTGQPTIKDTYTLVKVLEERIDHFIHLLAGLQRELRDHVHRHTQRWYFLIPTALILAQFLYAIIKGMKH